MKLKTFIMLSTNLNFDSTNVKIGKETNMKIHSYKYEYCFNTNPEVSSDQQSSTHVTCLCVSVDITAASGELLMR